VSGDCHDVVLPGLGEVTALPRSLCWISGVTSRRGNENGKEMKEMYGGDGRKQPPSKKKKINK